MEVAKATQVGHGQLSSDPMLSPPELVVNGGEKPNVDDATTSAAAAASNAPAANATTTASSTSSGAKIGESEDDEDEEEMEVRHASTVGCVGGGCGWACVGMCGHSCMWVGVCALLLLFFCNAWVWARLNLFLSLVRRD